MASFNYQPIFYPKSILLLGASANPMKFGGLFLNAQLTFGYKGTVYAVNPKGGNVQGFKFYRSVEEVPESADLGVITVPTERVIKAVQDCISNGVKGIQILSAGFSETSEEGRQLETEILRLVASAGIKLIGPNCFGVYSPQVGLTLLPGIQFPKEEGSVGFFSQSGGGICDTILQSCGRNVRFSLGVSFGNASGIGPEEMLEYFASDSQTKIVAGYIEGIKDGSRFIKALKACTRQKPVVILKVGKTELGQKGTIGHTGSMAGSGEIWDSCLRSCGAIQAKDFKDLAECIMSLQCLEQFEGRKSAILAGGGARVVEGLDAAAINNFEVPDLEKDSVAAIQALLPDKGSKAANPVDLANPFVDANLICELLNILTECQEIDFAVLYQILFYSLSFNRMLSGSESDLEQSLNLQHEEIANHASMLNANKGKPLIVILPDIASSPAHFKMEHGRMVAREIYTRFGIPCFDSAAQAFSVLKRIAAYNRFNHSS